jgi:hypothetical protein
MFLSYAVVFLLFTNGFDVSLRYVNMLQFLEWSGGIGSYKRNFLFGYICDTTAVFFSLQSKILPEMGFFQ